MTRNDDGSIKVSGKVLSVIIATCLAVGSSGAWMTKGFTTAAPAVVTSASASELKELAASVYAHHEAGARIDATQDAQIEMLRVQLEKMDTKLDRLLVHAGREPR